MIRRRLLRFLRDRRASAVAACALVAGVGASCGGGGDAAFRGQRVLGWSVAESAARGDGGDVVTRLPAFVADDDASGDAGGDAGDGAWHVAHPERARRVVEDGVAALQLEPGAGVQVLRCALPAAGVELERVDLARVALRNEGRVDVEVALVDDAGRRTRSAVVELPPSAEPRVVELDLSAALSVDDRVVAVEVRLPLMTHPCAVASVELVRRAAIDRLPPPGGPPRFVAAGTQSRPAVGLVPGFVLESAVPRDGTAVRGARLGVAALAASGVARGEGAVRVALLDARGAELAARTVEVHRAWRDVWFDVAPGSAAHGAARLRVTTDTAGGVLVSEPRVASPAADAPRTVLLVTSDTHRADHVGYAADGAGVETPTIDALAAAGVRFEDAASASSITNPSHAAMLTGLSVRDTGIVGNLVPLADRAETLAERFAEAGFRTFAATSARHLTPWRSGFGQGFERFDAPADAVWRDAADTIAAARAMLDDCAGQDVFLWLHLFDAHGPYDVRACCTARYYDGDPYDESVVNITEASRPRWDRRIRDVEYVRALYKGEVTYLDQRLDEFLRDEPRFRAGWIALTADHGESLGEQGLFWTHTATYPSTLRVPLLISGPGVPAGERFERPVSNTDVGRTLLELAGVVDPADAGAFPGASLLDPERADADRDAPRFAIGEGGMSATLWHGRWFCLLHLSRKSWGNPAPAPRHGLELYDLAADPEARDNVADRFPDDARRMRRALIDWLATAPSGGRLAGDASTSARDTADIAALGYAADAASAVDDEWIDPACACEQCARWR